MKKLFAIVSIILTLSLLLCACSTVFNNDDTKGASTTQKATTTTQKPTTTMAPNPTYKVFDGDYEYTFDGTAKGYDVCYVGDKNVSAVGDIKTTIEGWPVLTLKANFLSGCTNLTNVVIPSSITTIGAGAFTGCTKLTSVTIPSNVTIVGMGAFSECTNLTHVTIDEGVKIIECNAFAQCTNLVSVTFPNSLTNLGTIDKEKVGTSINYHELRGAFTECVSLTNIILPEGITTIGKSAFSGCASLTNIIIPSGVQTLECGAFARCSNLTSISIPSSVIAIGSSYQWGDAGAGGSGGGLALYNCTQLAQIIYDGTIEQWNELLNAFVHDSWFAEGVTQVQCADGVIKY